MIEYIITKTLIITCVSLKSGELCRTQNSNNMKRL